MTWGSIHHNSCASLVLRNVALNAVGWVPLHFWGRALSSVVCRFICPLNEHILIWDKFCALLLRGCLLQASVGSQSYKRVAFFSRPCSVFNDHTCNGMMDCDIIFVSSSFGGCSLAFALCARFVLEVNRQRQPTERSGTTYKTGHRGGLISVQVSTIVKNEHTWHQGLQLFSSLAAMSS